MNRKKVFYALMILWFMLIGAYTAYKEYYLRVGDEITLNVLPIDPRDIFRGDYVILNYDISSISKDQKVLGSYGGYMEEETLYNGEIVYVTLIKDGKFHKGGNIYKTHPEKGLFIKGKVETNQRFFGLMNVENASIIYGIENFFVPEDEGKIIESERNRNNVSAKVVINGYGNASIKELYIGDKKVDFKNNEKVN